MTGYDSSGHKYVQEAVGKHNACGMLHRACHTPSPRRRVGAIAAHSEALLNTPHPTQTNTDLEQVCCEPHVALV